MRSRIQIFTILLGAFALVGCHDVMSPAIITPPPGKIIYTKVDLRNYPIEDGSVKLVDPVSLEETKLGAGMVRSRPQQGRVAWAKRRNAELWDIVVTDPNGSNTMNAGQIDTRDRTLYGDGPVLSPTLDKVAFTVKEIVDFSGDPNERWQTYIHEPGTQAEYLSGEVFWWDGGNNEATAH